MYSIVGKHIVHTDTGEIMEAKFPLAKYNNPEAFIKDGVLGIEPMTAKEYLNEEVLEMMLNSPEYMAEVKLDGTRSTLHILSKNNRIFSRNLSKKSNWYSENTDSLPHLRDHLVEELEGTIIDGEMRIDGKEFKEVSSTLNCVWDEAIKRQIDLGFITFHAFDIIYYKGVYIAKMPLWKRKKYLHKVIKKLASPYVKEEFYTTTTIDVFMTGEYKSVQMQRANLNKFKETYPNLFSCVGKYALVKLQSGVKVTLTKKAWYEFIVANGGEGLMLKNINGTYRHTRGREYTKWKKFDTWDVIIIGYEEPKRDYEGKECAKDNGVWCYWYDAEDDSTIIEEELTMAEADEQGYFPCTKYYAKDWIGTIKIGVFITDKELEQWKKKNPKEKPELKKTKLGTILCIGDISGIDEDLREDISSNQDMYLNSVIEVKGQEVLKTGKLRHPRFLRFRDDKNIEQCTWKDHMRLD